MDWIRQYGWMVGAGAVGVGMLIYGLWGQIVPERVEVEVIDGSRASGIGDRKSEIGDRISEEQIVVDVAGAVERPGVYRLPAGSRVGDALVAAGGLASPADREWVARTLNLASEVKDGGKIYIPRRDESGSRGSGDRTPEGQGTGLVNINTAGVGELTGLWGIGEARAGAIVANRPYSATEELVSRAKIPQSVYDKIKDKVAVY